ncbi:MAG: ATP-binding protein, partial [Chitinispirillales bacterium]|nr:ATP-binding protein [Chitinispirillales bacterium]
EWKAHPVIHLDLNAGDYSKGTAVLDDVLQNGLENTARDYGVTLRGQTLPTRFGNLIADMHGRGGEKAVVIIDEYDKPLTNTLNKREIHIQLRDALKGFYGVLKSYDVHLRFIFITGVSKFSHVSIFSDLNQLTDLTLDPRYADICGLTQEELEANFEPEIEAVLKNTGHSREAYIGELRNFYNGYRFSENPLKIYNPLGILKHFYSGGKFSDYWYESATPSFLVGLLEQNKLNALDMAGMQVRGSDFGKYNIDDMEAAPILCQTGYLTISDYDEETSIYTLDFPNREVDASFAGSLLRHYLGATDNERLDTKFITAIPKGNLDGAMGILRRIFAGIPYGVVGKKECHFQTVVHVIFKMLGFNCLSEVQTADGRLDTMVETRNFVYCFEFKLDGSAEEALTQIDTKEYMTPWEGSGKKLFKVGVNFDYEKRNIDRWVMKAGENKG